MGDTDSNKEIKDNLAIAFSPPKKKKITKSLFLYPKFTRFR